MRLIHRCSVSGSSCHVRTLSGHDRTQQAACGKEKAGLVPRAEQEAETSSKFWDWKSPQKEQGRARAGMQMGKGCESHSPSSGSQQKLELNWPREGGLWWWEQDRQRAEFRALPAP